MSDGWGKKHACVTLALATLIIHANLESEKLFTGVAFKECGSRNKFC